MRGRPFLVVLTVTAALVAGCAPGADYSDTAYPRRSTTSASPATSLTDSSCRQPTQTYTPLKAIPRPGTSPDPAVRAILARGQLRVGVGTDNNLFGARNSQTGRLEGFDIDLARLMAAALFGDPDRVSFVVITAEDRIPALQQRRVDMVARSMTISCERWKKVAFSSEYLLAHQKLLVAKDSGVTSFQGLTGRPVCATTGTSAMQLVLRHPQVVPVLASNNAGCLVMFQQGRAEAVVADDAILAGLAAQDPYTKVTSSPLSTEPYGLGFNAKDVYLVRLANAVLARIMADGEWKRLYTRWLSRQLGPAPKPPRAVVGRGS